MSTPIRIIFCATARTGSTVIYDDFRNLLGCEPADGEFFYQEIINKRTQQTWPELWDAVQAPYAAGPVWAAKVMFHYTPYIAQFITGQKLHKTPPVRAFQPARFDAFAKIFSGAIWVHVVRADVHAQAVSMYFAETTSRWESRTDAPTAPVPPPPYDRDLLLTYLDGLLAERRQWPLFFAHYAIDPIILRYEDAASNYPHYLAPLLARADLPMPQSPPPRRLQKLGGATNAAYAARLRQDMAERS